jgi:hypothetical protein
MAVELPLPIRRINANDGKIPSNCRAAHVDSNGERHNLASELGEQFFVAKVPIPGAAG